MSQLFQASAGDAIFFFGGLIRIGGSADADMLGGAFAAGGEGIFGGDLVREQDGGVFLHEDFLFEGQAVQFHKFVGITGVAVFAGEFAAAIGIDGPIERDAAGFAFIENGFHREEKIFRAFA